jgi:hypothetical protein
MVILSESLVWNPRRAVGWWVSVGLRSGLLALIQTESENQEGLFPGLKRLPLYRVPRHGWSDLFSHRNGFSPALLKLGRQTFFYDFVFLDRNHLVFPLVLVTPQLDVVITSGGAIPGVRRS